MCVLCICVVSVESLWGVCVCGEYVCGICVCVSVGLYGVSVLSLCVCSM